MKALKGSRGSRAVVNVRIDQETQSQIAALAETSGLSEADIMRMAINEGIQPVSETLKNLKPLSGEAQ